MSSCPSLSDLKRLLLGELPAEEQAQLEAHFLGCESCVARAQTLSQDDTLTEALRSSSGADDDAERDVVERLIGQARRLAAPPHDQRTLAHDPNRALDDSAAFTSFLAPSQAPDELGRLGPYRVLKVLGHGGMGVVFLAHDPKADRKIALKVMLPQMAAKPDARDRFLREARTTAAIEHDHIVPLYQVDEDRGVPFLAMPLLKGASLEDWLTHRPHPKAPVELPRLLRLGREIALGLAAAHERGLIHRDIKPANIWLDAAADDRVKILDFGLARPVEANANLTQPGMIVGTASYMAPEQARGESVDGRADLYSLGCILYRFCTGRLPFTGPDVMAVLIAASTQPAKPVAELNPDLPQALAELVMQLLTKDPRQRPESARAVARTLQALERAVVSPDAVTLVQPATRAKALKHRGPVLAAGLLVVGLLGSAAVAFWSKQHGPTEQAFATQANRGPVADRTEPPKTSAAKRPLDPAWVKLVASLPAEKQAAEVLKELKRRNPDFDATLVEQKAAPNGNLHVFRLVEVVGLRDITPLLVLKDLEELSIRMPRNKTCELEDLSPLSELKRLRALTLDGTNIRDLTPLKDLPRLDYLYCTRAPLNDLTPLKDRKLKSLILYSTKIDNLDFLADQRDLNTLNLNHLLVSDLAPLRSLSKLTVFECLDTEVRDLTPLKDLPLKELFCPPEAVAKNADLLAKMPALSKLNGKKVADAIKEAGKK